MKHTFLLAPIFFIMAFCDLAEKKPSFSEDIVRSEKDIGETTIIYLIRHAEKDRSKSEDKDPSLDNKGIERAQRWAKYFEAVQIDHIYVTNYKRTRQTVSYTANQKALVPIVYDPHNIQLNKFLSENQGKTVLVVGHSNTIPKLINSIIGKNEFDDMDDRDNATLFKILLSENDRRVETITVE